MDLTMLARAVLEAVQKEYNKEDKKDEDHPGVQQHRRDAGVYPEA